MLATSLLPGCVSGHGTETSACSGERQRCAAAVVPVGMRQVRRGYRIKQARWLTRRNRESGFADIGIQAEWLPITERR